MKAIGKPLEQIPIFAKGGLSFLKREHQISEHPLSSYLSCRKCKDGSHSINAKKKKKDEIPPG